MATTTSLMGAGLPGELAKKFGTLTGTLTLNGTTEVTVSNTGLTSNHMILLARETVAGTPNVFYLFSRTNGTGFSVKGTASDTSVVRYLLVPIA